MAFASSNMKGIPQPLEKMASVRYFSGQRPPCRCFKLELSFRSTYSMSTSLIRGFWELPETPGQITYVPKQPLVVYLKHSPSRMKLPVRRSSATERNLIIGCLRIGYAATQQSKANLNLTG